MHAGLVHANNFNTVFQVIWIRLFKSSYADGGTMQQLKHLINRSNVPRKPKKDVNAAQDFLAIVTLGHIVAAAMSYFEMKDDTDQPKHAYLKAIAVVRSPKEQQSFFHNAICEMLKHNLVLTTMDTDASPDASDKVNMYARELLSLGLLMAEFDDAIKEGDGLRVMNCWKFLLLIFKSAKRKNYALEAFYLLAQYHVVFPPRQREQLLWSRFVNMKGKAGCNISADLYNEHLNRAAKAALGGQASNCSPKTIERTGKILGPIMTITEKFDEESKLHQQTSRHLVSCFKKDLSKIVTQLSTKSKVFNRQPDRQHTSFPHLVNHIVVKLKKENVTKWMKKKLVQMQTVETASTHTHLPQAK